MGQQIDFLKIAARQLFSKKFRVILTVLGIAIGVAAVIGTVSLGEGIRTQAIETIKAQSDLTIIEVSPGLQEGTVQLITEAKIGTVRSMPHVLSVAPIIRDSYATQRQTYLGAIGIQSEDLAVIRPLYLKGTSYAPGTNEVVMGQKIAEKLQRYEGIRFNDIFAAAVREYDTSGAPRDREVMLRVTGVLRERNDAYDDLIILDRSTLLSIRHSEPQYDGILVRVDDPNAVFPAVEKIISLGLTTKGAFEQINAVNRFMDMILLIFTFFAGISLVVGGLMITTTMITSIYERTREIGITMAIGASERDVVILVLYECLFIGILGGILGDLLGIIFAQGINILGKPFVISRLGPEFSGLFGSEITRITPEMLIGGFVIAIVLSIGAGIYPAIKAAHLNPVDAIRGSN
jgi:putative ABC transport system permease protein